MNWTRAIIAGVAGGIVLNIADFIMHGMIMANAYTKYPAFATEQANPIWFTLIAVCIGIATALLFARTRGSWAEGFAGGLKFGAFVGLVAFFPPFYNSIVINGFPYHMGWCWGGINFIGFVALGCTLGLIYKK
jgi:hypothetical protein